MRTQKNTTPSLRLRLLKAVFDEKPFTIGSLRVELGAQNGQLRGVLAELRDQGWVKEAGRDEKQAILFYLTTRGKAAALKELQAYEASSGDAQSNMWRTARKLKDFSAVDLCAWGSVPGAEVDLAEARRFCGLLLRGGYVRVTRKAKSGVNEALYRLVRDTGPKAPVEKRVRAVFDPNEDRLVHVTGMDQ